nr:hypothetical protein [Tanacetum cinerariifolium]
MKRLNIAIFLPTEAQQAASGPTSLGATNEKGAHHQLNSGTNPSILVDKTKSAKDGLKTIHTDSCTNKKSRANEISKKIKLEDLSDLMKDTRSAFFTPHSLQYEPIIVSDKSEEEETKKDKDTHTTSHDVPEDASVTDTLNKFATVLETASKAESKNVPSVGQATTSPAEGEKNTNLATRDVESTNLHNELVDLLGIDIVTQYYNKKLLYDKYCDKMLKRRKSSKIINCDVLTQKGPITLQVYREDGTVKVILNVKVSGLHLAE